MNTAGLRIVARAPAVVREDVPREACDAFVASHAAASSYHRAIWLDVIQRAFGHETKYLVAESARRIVGVLPLVFFKSRLFGRFAVSMPFLNEGGMLADNPEAERSLLQAAVDEVQRFGGSHLELRHRRQCFNDLTPRRHKVAMELRLAPTIDVQWQGLDRKVRNQIRKAEKSGLEVRDGGLELVDQFYAVFARNMRDLGTPVYDIRWFREVLAAFPEDARLFVVSHQGRPIAASLVHRYRETLEVPWASALREYNPLCGNVLLYWYMLQYGVASGAGIFDFGRSTPGEGTFHFKKQWGAEPRELVWEYWTANDEPFPDVSPKNPKYRLAIGAWQRLPMAVANALGPRIVRNIP